MPENMPLLLLGSASRVSLFRKKLGALIIFTCMLVNGFAFSTVEIGRYSLFMITIAATQNVVVSMFGKCNSSIAGISNKVCSYIGGILKVCPMQASSTTGNGEKKDGKANGKASGTVAIIIQSAAKRISNIISEKNERASEGIIYYRDLLWKYGALNSGCAKETLIVLAFMIFISAIRQRKLLDEAAGYIKKGKKTRISA